jgi:hypothetical protein
MAKTRTPLTEPAHVPAPARAPAAEGKDRGTTRVRLTAPYDVPQGDASARTIATGTAIRLPASEAEALIAAGGAVHIGTDGR